MENYTELRKEPMQVCPSLGTGGTGTNSNPCWTAEPSALGEKYPQEQICLQLTINSARAAEGT